MNKIIPFNKEIKFNEKIGEITSIALDDTLKFTDEYTIGGELIIRGCHKYLDQEEDFSYPIPTGISVDEKYDTSKAKISIDDFNIELFNIIFLKVKIDLILDDLFYKKEEIMPLVHNITVDETREDEVIENLEEIQDKNTNLEENDNENEKNDDKKEYSIYRVYLITNDDTLDDVLKKYQITKEELAYYNDLDNFKPGVKLIIPSVDE